MNLYKRTGIPWLDRLLSDGSRLCGMIRAVTLIERPDGVHVLSLYGHATHTGTREQLWPLFWSYNENR